MKKEKIFFGLILIFLCLSCSDKHLVDSKVLDRGDNYSPKSEKLSTKIDSTTFKSTSNQNKSEFFLVKDGKIESMVLSDLRSTEVNYLFSWHNYSSYCFLGSCFIKNEFLNRRIVPVFGVCDSITVGMFPPIIKPIKIASKKSSLSDLLSDIYHQLPSKPMPTNQIIKIKTFNSKAELLSISSDLNGISVEKGLVIQVSKSLYSLDVIDKDIFKSESTKQKFSDKKILYVSSVIIGKKCFLVFDGERFDPKDILEDVKKLIEAVNNNKPIEDKIRRRLNVANIGGFYLPDLTNTEIGSFMKAISEDKLFSNNYGGIIFYKLKEADSNLLFAN